MTPALAIDRLHSGYGRADDIIRGISLSVTPESILAVIGPNGSGKSTFVKTLAGLVGVRQGTIRVTGTDVTALSAARRVTAGLAYVPQDHNIFATLSIRENLKLATEFLHGRSGAGALQREFVMSLFPELGARQTTLAGNLSGGQRQMLAFASAMLANPEVLLLDEPSAGLSPRFVVETMQAVVRVRANGVTVVLVEQNVKAALGIADHAAVLVAGRLRLLAPAGDIRSGDLAGLFLSAAP